jgi:hypothetical protein
MDFTHYDLKRQKRGTVVRVALPARGVEREGWQPSTMRAARSRGVITDLLGSRPRRGRPLFYAESADGCNFAPRTARNRRHLRAKRCRLLRRALVAHREKANNHDCRERGHEAKARGTRRAKARCRDVGDQRFDGHQRNWARGGAGRV